MQTGAIAAACLKSHPSPRLLRMYPMPQVRKKIVPVNRKWPLHNLMTALQHHFPRHIDKSHPRHVLIEYVMLKDINDTLEDAHRYSHLPLYQPLNTLCPGVVWSLCFMLMRGICHSAVLSVTYALQGFSCSENSNLCVGLRISIQAHKICKTHKLSSIESITSVHQKRFWSATPLLS